MTPQEAVKAAYKNHPVMVSMKKELGRELVKAAIKGGADDVDAKELRAAMAKAWAQDGLTLSERTTKGNAWVVHTVSETIEAAVKKGGSVMAMAKEIFDGYGKAGYIAEQDLPQFLDELVGLGRACKEDRHFKIALREAERSASKLTTKGLQAAYNGILKAIEAGNQDRVAKAIYVAVQEKTRYFAERIARTEKARAYADGMMYKYAADPDCVAFKWKLSGRHPCDDVCDLYAKADLWGMGEGIFPKDKVPTLPVHPNCMCRLIPVYAGSKRLKSETPVDRTREGGVEYIKSLPEIARKSLLGVNGAEAVAKGADWSRYIRKHSKKNMDSRISRDIISVERPADEQDELKGFCFVGVEKAREGGLAAVNPRYHEAKKWRENCQRCVVAEELRNRGYDVTAKPFMKDGIGMDGFACWDIDRRNLLKDNGFVLVGRKSEFKQKVKDAFSRWGDGARAIIRVKWLRAHGGNGHLFSCHCENGKVVYTDPQKGEMRDIDATLAICTPSPGQMWIMRVDDRRLTGLVKEAVFNVQRGNNG